LQYAIILAMFDATPEETGGQGPAALSDPRIETAERHLEMLQHLASWGMDAAQACAALMTASGWRSKAVICEEGNVWSAESSKQVGMRGHRDAADAYHSVTRALRLTMALEAATAERLHDLRTGSSERRRTAAAEVESPARSEAAVQPEGHAEEAEEGGAVSMGVYRDTVRELVTEAIAAEVADESLAADMRGELRERLSERDLFGPLMFRPLREVVAKICDDIGLAPDWSQWEEDGWAVDYTPPRGPQWPLPWKPRRARVRQALAHAIASVPPTVVLPIHPPDPLPPAAHPLE
jgi:hypothetical protein